MDNEQNKPKIVIVGAGLVGTLNALFFGQTGKFDIEIYEKSSDLRKSEKISGRSINLSLSHRGLSALKAVGLEQEILRASIPMYGRMIHEINGKLKRFPYGKSHQCICAIDRKLMNELLLRSAETTENVKIFFRRKLVAVDFSKRIATFLYNDNLIEAGYDLLIGNDGAYSTVRQLMLKNMRMNFSQEFIPHGYIELLFPPNDKGNFSMEENCLHIWPRNEFMLIGLPNLDKSFTGTLFMPFDLFESIRSTKDLITFFESNFPDALNLLGRSNLEETFFAYKPAKMGTIRCKPYNLGDSCVIMGDAAHAMVPFYGQGMNCGFEDLIIFHDILKKNDFNLGQTCFDFSENRNQDANAMCELAVYNYIELRRNVTLKSFRWRKMFDNYMNTIFPSFWIPLYTMVCFTRIPYATCWKEKQKQDKIVSRIIKLILAVSITGSIYLITRLTKYSWFCFQTELVV